MKKHNQKFFSRPKVSPMPYHDLLRSQTDSFQWFLDHGVKEMFEEFFPVEDYTGKEFLLEFVNFSIGTSKYDETYAKVHNVSFEAPLKITARLTNKQTGLSKEQEIFLSDLPLMTKNGTFVINGIERVIVLQLSRSFGAYFTATEMRGKTCFGAKIIPGRGAWIELETEPDGVIYARIDRKRKIPVTSLMRVFGAGTDEEIEKQFEKIDNGPITFIKNTLKKDTAKTADEAFIELYKRLRPGEPDDMINMESSRDYINSMFDETRYDLFTVGRYRLNQRLGLPTDDLKNAPKGITLSDLMAIVSKVIELNNTPGAQPDDIDHLGNRRVRGVGELLQQRLRIGLTRMKRNIQDRMSTVDASLATPSNLINNRMFMAVLKDFFNTGQLSQFMSQINCLDELEHLRRLSAMGPGGLTRERAGFEVRDVHSSHYGRICPIETPEGSNVGLVVHLSVHAKLNEFGVLETPYRKVKDGKVTNEIVYLNAHDELKYNIAHASIKYDQKTGELVDDVVGGRSHSRPGLIAKDKIDFMDVVTNQPFSVATSMIPFLENDDANRALMGSNMQKQAVPCVCPEAPLVATGMEEHAARSSGRLVICEAEGVVEKVDATRIVVKEKKSGEPRTYKLLNFLRSNAFTALHQRPTVDVGDKVSEGEVMADNYSTDGGQMALGQNVLVAFLSWRGYNFEDAIIISEKAVRENKFSTIRIEEFSVNIRETKLGPEVNTYDIPNVGEEKLKNLDEEGIVRIGAEVSEGDILVGKISPKGEAELTPEERLLRSIFGEKARDVKDTSLRLDHGKTGRVIGVKIFSKENGDKLEPGIIKRICIETAQLRRLSVGDKLAGRHGNKGIVARILPVEDMPYLEDGTSVDLVLNPLGVASRMNIGQIFETHLGWAAHKLGYQAITPSMAGVTEAEIKEELKKAGIPEDGKVDLYDGRTGMKFNSKVTVGKKYMMKLNHMVDDKIHVRSIGPYSLITQQPLGGKAQGGGQRFGEMEVWALEGYGAAHTLQEMITIKSDDVMGRTAAYDSIIREEKFGTPNVPESFRVLVSEMRGLGMNVEFKKGDKKIINEKHDQSYEQ